MAIGTVIGHLVLAPTTAQQAGSPERVEPKYLSPIALVADKAGKTLYIAEATAGRVAVLDIVTRKVTAHVAIGLPVSGVAISPDGGRLYVTAGGAAGTLCVVDVASRKVVARIPVGHTPMSPVVSPDGRTVYVCNRFNNAIGVVDVAVGRQTATIDVRRQPVSADLSKDGKVLIVANHLPTGPANAKRVAAEVSIIDTAARKIAASIPLPDGSRGLRGVRVSPDGEYAAVTHTFARFHLPAIALERGWMNTNAVTLIDVANRLKINTILLDDVDHGAADPWAAGWTADGKTLCVTHGGTHELSVIDFPRLRAKLSRATTQGKADDVPNNLAFLIDCRRRVKLSGCGPRCIAVVGTRAFVGEYFTDSLSALDITPRIRPRVEPIALGPEREMTRARRGEMLFNDARMCFQTWMSCSTCHPDGRAGGLHWDMPGDGMNNAKNTKSLLLAHKTPPSMITGVRARAEVAVRAQLRFVMFGIRPEADAVAIDTYLKSLKPVPSPYLVNGKLNAAAQRGKKLFATAGCAECHSGPLLTDLKKHDVGTAVGARPGERREKFDTPTLREVWRTAPYLHAGQAATMLDVLSPRHNPRNQHGATANLTMQKRVDLAAYVLSL